MTSLAESEGNNIPACLQRLSLRVRDLLVFLDSFSQFMNPKQWMLAIADILIGILVHCIFIVILVAILALSHAIIEFIELLLLIIILIV